MGASQPSVTSASVRPRRRSEPTPPKRFGSETPRIFTPELEPLTRDNTLGFECIEFAEDQLKLDLMPWQKWFLLHALELHPTEVDEHGYPVFRFRKVILLVGRQNGKSTVMQALTLWRMYIDRCSLVIGTAQDLEIAESLWAECVEMAEETEELAGEIAKVEKGSGKKRFILRTGEQYKVKAATRRGGRGLSGELVLLDELREHQSWDAWAAVTKTTNAKARAQIYGISNAGDVSSLVLRYLRKMAHAEIGDPDGLNIDEAPADLLGEDEEVDDAALGIFEWSAPPGSSISDRDAWAQSNPALGHRVRESTLASDSKTDPEWVFRTEVLCQWSDGSLVGPFAPGSWEDGVDITSTVPDANPIVYGLDVSTDRTWAYIGWAGKNANGVPHAEIMEARPGVHWVVDWFTKGAAAKPMSVVIQAKGAPASSFIPDLDQIPGLTVIPWGGSDLGTGTANLFDLVKVNGVKHLPQPRLDLAAATGELRTFSDGARVWDRVKSPTDIAPLVAVTGALWGLGNVKAPAKSAYETRRFEMV